VRNRRPRDRVAALAVAVGPRSREPIPKRGEALRGDRVETGRPECRLHPEDHVARAGIDEPAGDADGLTSARPGRAWHDLADVVEGGRVAALPLEGGHQLIPLLREVLDIPDVGAGKQPARPETGRQPDPARPLAAQVDRRTARGARRGSVDGGAERVERVVAADPRRPRGLRGPQGAKRLNRRDQAVDPRADRWELEAE